MLLADYAGALKMGLDPYVSEISRRTLQRIGLPPRYRIEGNLAPYPGWVNVHPVVVDSSRKRDAWTMASRGLKPWLQVTDSELFPFKDPVDARVNAVLAPRFANVDGDRSAFWTLVLANYALSSLHGGLESYRVLWDKDALRRREAPLNLDLGRTAPRTTNRHASCSTSLHSCATCLSTSTGCAGATSRTPYSSSSSAPFRSLFGSSSRRST